MGRKKLGTVDSGSWKGKSRGDIHQNYGFSRSGDRPGSGSDSLLWRKGDDRSSGEKKELTEKGEEVNSPQKMANEARRTGNPKQLNMEEGLVQDGEHGDVGNKQLVAQVKAVEKAALPSESRGDEGKDKGERRTNRSMCQRNLRGLAGKEREEI